VGISRDGNLDDVTVLTSQEDSAQDLVVVLFGDGAGAAAGPLRGWGFTVTATEGGPWIYQVFWDKAADRVRWTGAGFESDPGHAS
jgi:hypothetical protein